MLNDIYEGAIMFAIVVGLAAAGGAILGGLIWLIAISPPWVVAIIFAVIVFAVCVIGARQERQRRERFRRR